MCPLMQEKVVDCRSARPPKWSCTVERSGHSGESSTKLAFTKDQPRGIAFEDVKPGSYDDGHGQHQKPRHDLDRILPLMTGAYAKVTPNKATRSQSHFEQWSDHELSLVAGELPAIHASLKRDPGVDSEAWVMGNATRKVDAPENVLGPKQQPESDYDAATTVRGAAGESMAVGSKAPTVDGSFGRMLLRARALTRRAYNCHGSKGELVVTRDG
ncbi:hypothetical protein K488DRAFT_72677 [Vararia minispora EC-137]|uniref:Uncharacterized protein n=1 Tax=Vararia minispora EC-137 TaxID=1314806 RepID=A0ACB8QDD8_9AGAM|nr:hypothetical protein K488DRAFT_72677 [Vararia minispora EC-137]